MSLFTDKVKHVTDESGIYKIADMSTARQMCRERGMRLATLDELWAAWRLGFDMCSCGWLEGNIVRYPIRIPRKGCGSWPAGIRSCAGYRTKEGWDAYCTIIGKDYIEPKDPVAQITCINNVGFSTNVVFFNFFEWER